MRWSYSSVSSTGDSCRVRLRWTNSVIGLYARGASVSTLSGGAGRQTALLVAPGMNLGPVESRSQGHVVHRLEQLGAGSRRVFELVHRALRPGVVEAAGQRGSRSPGRRIGS